MPTLIILLRMLTVLALALTARAAEAKRFALVIGNPAYQVGPLANPVP